jgi:hypothetical protein
MFLDVNHIIATVGILSNLNYKNLYFIFARNSDFHLAKPEFQRNS